MEINHPQWTVSSCFSYLYIWMISNIRFTVNVMTKMLFINGPIDDGSIPKGIEPFVVFKRIIHVDRTLPKRVNVEISFEIRIGLFCLQIILTKAVLAIILY